MERTIGLVGTGSLGTYLGEQFRDAEGATIAALADVSDRNRHAAGEALAVSADRRFEAYGAMLDAVDLDAVVIATPHSLHYEQIVTAMDRGLHVLCEKPLTVDLDHARDLVRRDEESPRTLMVGYQRHVDPAFVEAARRIDEFAGPPTFVTAEITQNWIEHQRGAWRTNPVLSGGGQLYDTGSHLVAGVLWTTGLTPATVSAEMVFDDADERVDVQAMVNVEFEEGTVASISVSGDAPQVREHIHVSGPEDTVYVTGEGWADREVSIIDAEGGEYYPPSGDESPTKAEAFLDAIETGSEPPATARDALAVTAVTEAAYESARTGQRVDVDLEA